MTALPTSEFQESSDTPLAIEHIPLERIEENPANPRKVFKDMDELVQSVRDRGVLQPILVRPLGNRDYQVVFGARRVRAAVRAGLKTIPAMIRHLGDPEALEIMIIENAKRADVHQLEEAQGYAELHTKFGQDVSTIAAKVGRSVAYVYDRMKLLSLTPDAQKQFLDGMFTAGHAILLARLSPEMQAEAINPDAPGGLYHYEAPLFMNESADSDDPMEGLRAVSVRRFSEWIDKNVLLKVEAEENLQLFPDLVETVKRAQEQALKVVHITSEHQIAVPPHERDGQKIYGPATWRDARQEQCADQVMGVVVIGENRGQSFHVCVAKKTCKTHWAAEIKEAKKRAKQTQGDVIDGAPAKKQETWEERNARAQAEHEAQEAIWKKAEPIILKDLQKNIAGASVAAAGEVVAFLINELDVAEPEKDESPVGILRHFAFEVIADSLRDSWRRADVLKDVQRRFGFDGAKVLKEIANQEKKAAKEAEKAAAKEAKAKEKPAKKSKAKADKPKAAKKAKAKKGDSAL